MRHLILMRHGKSEPRRLATSDHSRRLNDRGRRDVPVIAEELESMGHVPDLVLHSTATRVTETVERLTDAWSNKPPCSPEPSLYLAGAETVLATIRTAHSGASTLMIVGHNPGLSQLASVLADMGIQMPTGSAVLLECHAPDPTWIRADDFRLVEFMRPKALAL